jgi:hypothetical protein
VVNLTGVSKGVLKFDESDLFKLFQKIQLKNVLIVFGDSMSFTRKDVTEPVEESPSFDSDKHFEYSTHRAYKYLNEEMLEDKPIPADTLNILLKAHAVDLMTQWADDLQDGEVLYLRNLPKYEVEQDFLTGSIKVYFSVRFYNDDYKGTVTPQGGVSYCKGAIAW